MKKVLTLGFDNACHSQMMAALIKHITFNRVDVMSAGIHPKKIHPLVIKVLQEIGIDVSKEKSNSFNELVHTKFDIIITTSEEARNVLDNFIGNVTKIHKEFDDPRTFRGNKFDRENAFRELRDEMHEWLNEFIVRHRLVS
jgi:arsenate reductase